MCARFISAGTLPTPPRPAERDCSRSVLCLDAWLVCAGNGAGIFFGQPMLLRRQWGLIAVGSRYSECDVAGCRCLSLGRIFLRNPARVLRRTFYTFPSCAVVCAVSGNRKRCRLHLVGELRPGVVMRSKEMSSARSSLGRGAIDVKRFLAGFPVLQMSPTEVVNFARVQVRVYPVANCMLKNENAVLSLANSFHLLVCFQGLHAAVPTHRSGTPLAL